VWLREGVQGEDAEAGEGAAESVVSGGVGRVGRGARKESCAGWHPSLSRLLALPLPLSPSSPLAFPPPVHLLTMVYNRVFSAISSVKDTVLR
jgi:hypothetical protein